MRGSGFRRIGNWPKQLNNRLQEFLRYLEERRSDAGYVLRRDIDPLDLPSFLPGMMMIDRVKNDPGRDRPRYRYRLSGTEHRTRNGRELTGLWFDEVQPPDMIDELEQVFAEILDTGAVHYKLAYNTTSDNAYQMFERVLCPLSLDGRENSILIGYYIWQ